MRDIYNTKHRYSLAIAKLNRSSITDADKRVIKEYVNYRVVGGLGLHRAIKYISTLRIIAEHLSCTFNEATIDDITDLVSWIHIDKDSDSTILGYLTILRKFYIHYNKPELVNWYFIKKPKRIFSAILDELDILVMIQACTNLRDQAMVAGLYESSTRVGEFFASLKIGDIDFDSPGALLNVDGKTGPRRVRIVFSAPYLKNWINIHPLKEDPNSYLWVGIGTVGKNKPLDHAAIIRSIQRIAKRAGIQKHINLKTFRHSRATFLSDHLTSSQLDEYQGWVQGSIMPRTYIHRAGVNIDKSILQLYGLEPEPIKPVLVPRFCPECRTLNAPTYGFCMECGIYIGPILSNKLRVADGGDQIYRTMETAVEKQKNNTKK